MKHYPKYKICEEPSGYKIFKAVSTRNDVVLRQWADYYWVPLNNKAFKTEQKAQEYLNKIEKDQL